MTERTAPPATRRPPPPRPAVRATRLRLVCCALLWLGGAAHAAPKLYVFDCGLLSFEDISRFGVQNHETDVREMFVPCYLIEHAAGRLLWDSGLPLAMAGQGPVQRRPGTLARYDVSIVDQLVAMGLEPRDIDYLAVSHMHFDHAGGVAAFADSTLLIQRAEYEAAFQRAEEISGYEPPLYSALRDAERVLLDGDHDVFGDGTVRIVSTPGHTPGHQVLVVELAQPGPVVLSGDLYHFEVSRTRRRVPTFNVDAEQTLASMDKVERLLQASGATLWIEHNLELANELRKAPEFYE